MLRLNFCVRDGNRWVPQAIVTGNLRCKRLLLPPFCFRRFGRRMASRLPQFGVALGFGTLMPCTRANLDAIAAAFLAMSVRPSYGLPTAFRHFGVRNRFRTLKTAQGRASLAPDQGALSALPETPLPPYRLPLPNQFFPRSSPRPISIIKLHTLPHFHR